MFLESNSSSPAEFFGLAHIDSLYSYALVLTRNRTEAEDLVQETYVRALKAMVRLKAGSNVKSWLFTILRNVWLNQLRHRRTAPQLVEMDLDGITGDISVETSNNPHAIYVSAMECNLVREAIQRLPPEFREIILLREYEELSYREIATILKCPIGTVMSRLARARSKLRILLRAADLGARSKADC
jgi:RNA polymerase sigma-70 factor (ECF subfamily)